MKIPLLKRREKKLTATAVIQTQLMKAYDVYPTHMLPSAVVSALEDAGFLILSADQLDYEIQLAYQAGTNDGNSL